MKNIKAILFDLDGTLRHNIPTGDQVFAEYALGLGLRISGEDEKRALRWEHYYFASSPEIRADMEEYKVSFVCIFCVSYALTIGKLVYCSA